jgi:hypothetical protein
MLKNINAKTYRRICFFRLISFKTVAICTTLKNPKQFNSSL